MLFVIGLQNMIGWLHYSSTANTQIWTLFDRRWVWNIKKFNFIVNKWKKVSFKGREGRVCRNLGLFVNTSKLSNQILNFKNYFIICNCYTTVFLSYYFTKFLQWGWDSSLCFLHANFYLSFNLVLKFATLFHAFLHAFLCFVTCQSFLASGRSPAGWCVSPTRIPTAVHSRLRCKDEGKAELENEVKQPLKVSVNSLPSQKVGPP